MLCMTEKFESRLRHETLHTHKGRNRREDACCALSVFLEERVNGDSPVPQALVLD